MRRRAFLAAGALALLAAGWGTGRFLSAREARARLRALEDVLQASNDNDPRLDRDFKALSLEAKRLFREKYRSVAPERRNERGTIVYLLGMNLSSSSDWAFLREVVGEPACLSLADCSRKDGGGGAPGDEVTLAYPALVALRQAQRALEEARGGVEAKEAMSVIRAARASRMPAVVRMLGRIDRGA